MHKRPKKVSVLSNEFPFLLHPYNANLLTCKGKDGESNVMAVAWIIPVSTDPPLLAMSIRPQRHSYKLIMETKEFVVNIPTFEMSKKVLFCGRRSGKNFDKLEEISLSSQEAEKVDVPIIKDCIAHIECKLVNSLEIGDHTLMVGQVVAACALENCFRKIYDVRKFHPCQYLGNNTFTTCIEESLRPEI